MTRVEYHVKHMAKGAVIPTGIFTTIILGWVGWSSITTIQNGRDISSLQSAVSDIPQMKQDLDTAKNSSLTTKAYMEAILPRYGLSPQIIKDASSTP